MATATELLTAEEFWELPSSRWSELIDGVVIEMFPPGGEHGRRQMKVGRVLFRAEDSGVGYVVGEIQTKIREWIEAGARQVWVLYPDSRSVHAVRSLQDRVTLSGDDVLDGGDAVPGFSCRVSELFD